MEANQQDFIGSVFYFGCLIFLVSRLFRQIRLELATGAWAAIHFSILGAFALQGGISLIFSYIECPLSYWTLAAAMLIASVFICLTGEKNNSVSSKTIAGYGFAVLTGYGFSFVAGFFFYTPDLLPSSMTGDPVRHFLSLVNLNMSSVASAYKPIYYIWAGLIVHLLPCVSTDKAFVVSSCLLLGVAVASVQLFAVTMIANLSRWSLGLMAILVAFGYHYFALQYGYFTLLLSSSYVFLCFACLLLTLNKNSRSGYSVAMLMFAGVALTHAYFIPELALAVFVFSVLRVKQRKVTDMEEMRRVLPGWIFALITVLASNSFFVGGRATETLMSIVTGKGYGTGNLFGNLAPFILLALPSFIYDLSKDFKITYAVLLSTAGLFTLLMFGLSQIDIVHTYYVNRNLLVLFPVLQVGLLAWLERLDALWRSIIVILVTSVLLAPYLLCGRIPLSLSNQRFLDLLNGNNKFIYLANPEVVSLSPLEFTASDRKKLMALTDASSFRSQDLCRVADKKVAILGTDHEVSWISYLVNASDSPFEQWNQVITPKVNEENYRAWLENDSVRYLFLVKHINYEVPGWVVEDLNVRADLVCHGDSFELYRKRAVAG